jgi:rhamnogalacturonan endolyase
MKKSKPRSAGQTGAGWFFAVILLIGLCPVMARRQTEPLDRGLIAVARPDGSVYLSWRLLNSDPADIAFNLYRQTESAAPVTLNEKPLTQTTDFVDASAPLDKANQWFVSPVLTAQSLMNKDGVQLSAHPPVQNYLAIPFQSDYVCSKVAIADLNGDGRYDYIIKQPAQITDPGVWRKSTETFKVEAYLHDGTFLWRKDLGWNIEQGVWWSPMMAFDFDGDGRAEVAVKTAPTDKDYRNSDDHAYPGRVMSGPEYCSILDGMTGKELDRAAWPARGNVADWGDDKKNRASRHLMGVAFLDGKRPSLLVLRGTYTLMRVDAYNVENKKLVKLWNWSGDDETPPVRGQGMHGLHAVDLDSDGCDEIVLGSAVLDDNGKILWNIGLGHPDACYVTDILPGRPGLEIIYGIEPKQPKNGICLVDARTGEMLWGCQHPTLHAHSSGVFADFDPANPGFEFHIGEKEGPDRWTYAMDGTLINQENLGRLNPPPLYWGSGTLKPYAINGKIRYYHGPETGDYEGTILAVADILGDWREELITVVPGQLRIYATTIPASDRRVTLMQDALYRLDVAMVSMGYLYPPQTSYPLTSN